MHRAHLAHKGAQGGTLAERPHFEKHTVLINNADEQAHRAHFVHEGAQGGILGGGAVQGALLTAALERHHVVRPSRLTFPFKASLYDKQITK